MHVQQTRHVYSDVCTHLCELVRRGRAEVRVRSEVDNAPARPCDDEVQQAKRELEVAQMVGMKLRTAVRVRSARDGERRARLELGPCLHLNAVGGLRVRHTHDSGVVDQDIQTQLARAEGLRQRSCREEEQWTRRGGGGVWWSGRLRTAMKLWTEAWLDTSSFITSTASDLVSVRTRCAAASPYAQNTAGGGGGFVAAWGARVCKGRRRCVRVPSPGCGRPE